MDDKKKQAKEPEQVQEPEQAEESKQAELSRERSRRKASDIEKQIARSKAAEVVQDEFGLDHVELDCLRRSLRRAKEGNGTLAGAFASTEDRDAVVSALEKTLNAANECFLALERVHAQFNKRR